MGKTHQTFNQKLSFVTLQEIMPVMLRKCASLSIIGLSLFGAQQQATGKVASDYYESMTRPLPSPIPEETMDSHLAAERMFEFILLTSKLNNLMILCFRFLSQWSSRQRKRSRKFGIGHSAWPRKTNRRCELQLGLPQSGYLHVWRSKSPSQPSR